MLFRSGLLDASDALLILQYSTNLRQFNNIQQILADVNYNGEIGPDDALSVLQHSVNLIDSFSDGTSSASYVEIGLDSNLNILSRRYFKNANKTDIILINYKKLPNEN